MQLLVTTRANFSHSSHLYFLLLVDLTVPTSLFVLSYLTASCIYRFVTDRLEGRQLKIVRESEAKSLHFKHFLQGAHLKSSQQKGIYLEMTPVKRAQK